MTAASERPAVVAAVAPWAEAEPGMWVSVAQAGPVPMNLVVGRLDNGQYAAYAEHADLSARWQERPFASRRYAEAWCERQAAIVADWAKS